jgi:hypothetical protein
MDLSTLLRQIEAGRDFWTLANDPAVQLGPPARPLLGPSLLPERTVNTTEWTEEAIRYKTIIANSGTRYSPPQRRPSGLIFGSMRVSLGHQDILSEFTSRDYDALLRYLRNNASMQGQAALMGWADRTLVRPLVYLQEKMRWDAIVNASVVMAGDNGYTETVSYPNPAGARVAAGAAWSNPATDPYPDITAMVDYLDAKGYTANRFITSRKVSRILVANPKMASRAGAVQVRSMTDIIGRATLADINNHFASDGLPAIETYDNTYQDLTGTKRFLPDNVFVILATTGNDETIALPNGEPRVFENVLGFSAIGPAAGFDTPGRQTFIEAHQDKPPRIEGQMWQSTLPVLLEPEAITVITGIS